ncbi:hypothetical protein FHY30_003703 [Xanthomonas arboricola]|nr:hypothetical protein [Xanthomonas campestris]
MWQVIACVPWMTQKATDTAASVVTLAAERACVLGRRVGMWRLAAVRRLQLQAAASVNASIQRKAHRHQPVGLHRLAVLHCRLDWPLQAC